MKVMKNIPRLIMLAVLTLIAVVFVIPIFYSVFNSFKSHDVMYRGWNTPKNITS